MTRTERQAWTIGIGTGALVTLLFGMMLNSLPLILGAGAVAGITTIFVRVKGL